MTAPPPQARQLDALERLFARSGAVDAFNIAARARFIGVDAATLLAAAHTLVAANPDAFMGLDSARRRWQPATRLPEFSTSDRTVDQQLEAALQHRFAAASPLLQGWVVASTDSADLILAADHVFCDAVSLLRFIHAVGDVAAGRDAAEFAAPLGTRWRAIEPRNGAIQTWRAWAQDLRLQAGYHFRRGHAIDRAATPAAAVIRYGVDGAVLRALGQRARAHRLTLSSVIQAAHLKAAAEHVDGAEQLGMTFSNLRGAFYPPVPDTEFGSPVGLIPYRANARQDLWSLAGCIQEQVFANHRGQWPIVRPYWAGPMMSAMQRLSPWRLCDVALSWSDRLPAWRADGMELTMIDAFISPTRLGPLLGIWAQRLPDGGLRCCGCHLPEHLSRAAAQVLADRIADTLQEAATA